MDKGENHKYGLWDKENDTMHKAWFARDDIDFMYQ